MSVEPSKVFFKNRKFYFQGSLLICSECENSTWCDHRSELIRTGFDSTLLYPGKNFELPIVPARNVFVEVVIDSETFGTSALMRMNYAPEIGRPYDVNLGFWNPGEGMASIRLVIVDYMKSKLAPGERLGGGKVITPCPNFAHSLQAQRIMDEALFDSSWKYECLWNIVMEKACTPCVEDNTSSPDNFGIDPSLGGTGPLPWSS